MTAITSELKNIPWSSIWVPDDNYRLGDLPRIPEMGQSLKENGQIEPIVVEKGVPAEVPEAAKYQFTLVAGARRFAGFEFNGWKKREIAATVRTYPKGDVFAPIVDNWTSNEESAATSPLDRALLCHQLVTGTHPRAVGQPMERKEVERRLNINDSYLGKMLKIAKNLDSKVAKKARAKEVSLRFLLVLAAQKGADEAERAAKQDALLQAWIESQAALEAEGRQRRAPKAEKKAKKPEPEPVQETRARVVGAKPVDEKKRSGADYLRALQAKLEGATREDGLRLTGMIAATKFFIGKTKTMAGLTAADFKAVEAVDEEEATGEEDGDA